MTRSLLLLAFVSVMFSCSSSKEYTWENKSVTERKFKRKMNQYTKQFVKNMTQEQLNLFTDLQVVYDTTKTP